MAYWITKFIDTNLPQKAQRQTLDTGTVPPCHVALPGGGVVDTLGTEEGKPQPPTIRLEGTVSADDDSGIATMQASVAALMALRGKRGKLYRTPDGGSANSQWIYARCMQVRTDRSVRDRLSVSLVFQFALEENAWHGADGTTTVDVTVSAGSTKTVTNDGNVTCRDVVLRLKAWMGGNAYASQVFFYDDSEATYTDLTNTYDQDFGTYDTITAMTAADYIYIGYSQFFDKIVVNLGTQVNDNTAVEYVDIYNGSWSTVGTKHGSTTQVGDAVFAQDGLIHWLRESMTLASVNGSANRYWARIAVSATLDDIDIKELRVKYFPVTAVTAFGLANRTPGHQSDISYAGTVTYAEELEIQCNHHAGAGQYDKSVRKWVTPSLIKEYTAGYGYYNFYLLRDEDESTYDDYFDDWTSGDYFYVGYSEPFDAIRFDVITPNDGAGTITAQYWDGSAWTDTPGFYDGTSSAGVPFAQDGAMSFNAQSNWGTTAVDGGTMYWARIDFIGGTLNTDQLSIAEVDVRLLTDLGSNLTVNAPPHSIDEWFRLGSGANYLVATRTGGAAVIDLDVEFEDAYA